LPWKAVILIPSHVLSAVGEVLVTAAAVLRSVTGTEGELGRVQSQKLLIAVAICSVTASFRAVNHDRPERMSHLRR
jgi:hypothetical protein